MINPLTPTLDALFRFLVWAAGGMTALGFYHTFRRWAIAKKVVQGAVIVFLIEYTLLTVLFRPQYASLALLCACWLCALGWPMPISRLRRADGICLWLPVGMAFVLQSNGVLASPINVLACALLMGGFLFLRLVYGPKLMKRNGQLAFLSCAWCCFCRMLVMVPSEWAFQILEIIFFWSCWLSLTFMPYSSREKPIILFDLDGTLIDSKAMIFETFRRVFHQKLPGHSLTQEELDSFFGPSLEETFIRYFPENEVEDVIGLYQKINMEIHDEMVKAMPHAHTLVKTLKEKGYTVGVVSNKRIAPVLRGLQVTNLLKDMDIVCGKADKPDPTNVLKTANHMGYSNDRILYIGDTPGDLQAARRGAYAFAAYTLDKRLLQKFRQEKDIFVLNDLMDLVQVLEEEHLWIDKSIW